MGKDMTIAFFFHDANIYSGATMALLDLIEFYKNNKYNMQIIAVFPVREGTAIEFLKRQAITVISSHYSNISRSIYENSFLRVLKYPRHKYIAKEDLSKQVIYLGLVKDMNKLREKMNVGIVASEMEGFGRVTIDGMLSGMIMIGRNIGGTGELIQDNINGIIVSNTLNDLSEKVDYVYQNYSKLEYSKRQCI